jgi:diguanylate cyclase (GGDEF)-like protein/PAS domain S-box-containing protein
MAESMDGSDVGPRHAFRPRPEPRRSTVEQSGPHPAAPLVPLMDPVERAELRRARHAVFGPGAAPQAAAFADRVAQVVGDREPSIPAPNEPGGSGRIPAARRALPAPHEVVATTPRREPLEPTAADGPESVPLPSAPALVCDGSDRIVRVNPELLALAGRAVEGGAGLFGMRLPQLLVGPDTDARLVRPDGEPVRVRVLRWDVPGRELRAVVLVELGASVEEQRAAERRRVDELEQLAHAGTWTYDLTTGILRRSAALEDLYRRVGLDPDRGRAALEGDQVERLCAALRAGGPGEVHQGVVADLEPASGHRLECRAEVERAADGTVVRLVGMVREVDAERLAQARVRRSAQRFEDLVAVLPHGVATVDPGGRILEVNPAFAALLATPAGELRGSAIASVAVDPTGERPAGAFPQWLHLRRPGARHGYSVESVPLRRGDGSTVWADLRVSVTATEDGDWFWMIVCADLSERRAAAEQLRRVVHTDPLTGLATRDGALRRLDELLAGPRPATVAAVCVGVDDFRRVNSSAGHAAGDAALATFAGRLRAELPDGCTAARLSGDEFVVVCADHREVGGPAELARMVADVPAGVMVIDARPVRLTATAGVAAGVVGRDTTAADLLRDAEVAMHEAKRRGVRTAVATDELVASAGTALALEVDLRAALTGFGEGLVLHFQPVVGPDGVVRSAEALIRWEHPERGMIPPGEFLPIAQRCGLLRELDLWVLRAATREAARWPAHDGAVPSVAVNLAGLLPADPDFVAAVTDVVEASGLAWERLVLELVESSLVELSPAARVAMGELVARGVRFAVDDFGTGWSGLARLRDLSAQIVKLDRAFVSGIADDPLDAAVAGAVLELARVLGCAVVAEGVETVQQYRVLCELGVESVQGWLFARALPAAELRALLVGDRLRVPE